MKAKNDLLNNVANFHFKDDDPFDPGILEKIQKIFFELDQKRELLVEMNGNVPIEILAYIAEVSNHCNMILNIIDDIKGREFIEQLKMMKSLNIKIKDNNGAIT